GLITKARHSWGNPIWGDINNDGFVDLIVPTHGLLRSHGPFVYLNNAGKTFTDIHATSGITRHVPLDAPDWHGFSFGDYDGDGNLTQIANAAGLESATHGSDEGFICSFADYDNDGFMDVAFSGCCESEELYRNQGDGTFVDVTAAAGLNPHKHCQGIAWGDYNNDGLLDLYVARGSQGDGPFQNTLYRNNGDGTFTDVTAEAGVVGGPNNWAALWGDYDNDGFLDLFVANPGVDAEGVGNANLLYHNNGDGTFTDRATEDGLALQD